jgi:hypothetical protein
MKIIDEIEAISVSRIANASMFSMSQRRASFMIVARVICDHCRAVSFHKAIFGSSESPQLRPAARLVSRERNLANDTR